MGMELPLDIDNVKGFMPKDEGEALYDAALAMSQFGPCLFNMWRSGHQRIRHLDIGPGIRIFEKVVQQVAIQGMSGTQSIHRTDDRRASEIQIANAI